MTKKQDEAVVDCTCLTYCVLFTCIYMLLLLLLLLLLCAAAMETTTDRLPRCHRCLLFLSLPSM
jgi:hypothetical protein